MFRWFAASLIASLVINAAWLGVRIYRHANVRMDESFPSEKSMLEVQRQKIFAEKISSPVGTVRDRYTAKQKYAHLSHLVIPFAKKQLGRVLERIDEWNDTVPPCSKEWQKQRSRPALTLYLDCSRSIGLEEKVRKALSKSTLECFREVTFAYAKLRAHESGYLDGSLKMFELMLDHKIGMKSPSYIFYMEPDCIPIRPGWLEAVERAVRFPNPHFWVRGSLFTGEPSAILMNDLENLLHINGNAWYNLGDPDFAWWYFNQVKPFFRVYGQSLAFDLDTFAYLLQRDNWIRDRGKDLKAGSGTKRVLHNRHYAHFFQYSRTIRNMWRTTYNITEVMKEHPETYLLHGGTPKIE